MDAKKSLSYLDAFSVRSKLIGIPAALMAGIAAGVVYTVVTLEGQKIDSAVIDAAARQNVFSQRYVTELLLASQGVHTDIGYTRKVLADSMDALINGGSVVLGLGKEQRIELPAPSENSGAYREKLQEEKTLMDDLFVKGDEFMRLGETNPSYGAKRQEVLDLGSRLDVCAGDAVKLYRAFSGSKIEAMIRNQTGLSLLAAIFGMSFTWLTVKRILNPLAEISNVAGAVTSGNLAVKVTYSGTDEVGVLGEAVNKMVDELSKVVDEIRTDAQALSNSAEELSASSQQMGSNAQQTSGQANSVSAAAEVVSKNFETVSTATEEMAASIKEIAKNAAEAAQVAESAARVAETTNSTVAKLGDSSSEIGNVIKVITSIAEQTNLLALNATIEAARAGDAGKGFAVVANEVKELAKETAKATEDISRRIETIQGDATEAVQTIGEIATVIKRINDIQNTIASAVEQQTAATKEISFNIAQSAQGSSDIARNITGVAQAADNTQQSATASNQAAHDLSKMASTLQGLVGRFRLHSGYGRNGKASMVVQAAERIRSEAELV